MNYRYSELYDPYLFDYDWQQVNANDIVTAPVSERDGAFVLQARMRASELKCSVLFEPVKGFFGAYIKASFKTGVANAAPISFEPNESKQ